MHASLPRILTHAMSFYLLPPVSYQTQQKLKSQMNSQKRLGLRRASHADDRASMRSLYSRKQLVVSAAESVLTKASSGRISSVSSQLETVDTPALSLSGFLAESRLDSVSLDHIAVQDECYRTSSGATANTVLTLRKKQQAFNYDCATDINEILQFSKDQQRRKSKVRLLTNSMDLRSLASAERHKEVKMVFNDVDFSGSKEDLSVPCEDDTLEDDEETQLARTYSNVSSIFSTKEDPKTAPSTSRFRFTKLASLVTISPNKEELETEKAAKLKAQKHLKEAERAAKAKAQKDAFEHAEMLQNKAIKEAAAKEAAAKEKAATQRALEKLARDKAARDKDAAKVHRRAEEERAKSTRKSERKPNSTSTSSPKPEASSGNRFTARLKKTFS